MILLTNRKCNFNIKWFISQATIFPLPDCPGGFSRNSPPLRTVAMVSALLENLLVKTDTLLERLFYQARQREPVSFSRYLTDPRKILLVAGENLAGFILSFHFIEPLLEKFPEAEIWIVVRPEEACLIENHKRVQIIPWGPRSLHTFDSQYRKTAAVLREESFDWAINLSFSGRPEALLTYHSEAKIRTGLNTPDNERYYNLIVKNIPPEPGFLRQFGGLFRALHVEGPQQSGPSPIRLTDAELHRGKQFVRQRKSLRTEGQFIGFIPEWRPGLKSVERLLQGIISRLIRQFDPMHLLIAGNLAPADELRKLSEISPYTFFFDDLRHMFSSLASCDRLITNSIGAAITLASLGGSVELVVTDEKYLARLAAEELDKIRIIRDENGSDPLLQAL